LIPVSEPSVVNQDHGLLSRNYGVIPSVNETAVRQLKIELVPRGGDGSEPRLNGIRRNQKQRSGRAVARAPAVRQASQPADWP